MAVTKTRRLVGVDLLPDEIFRVVIKTYYKDSADGSETQASEPQYIQLNPLKPEHQPVINAARSVWNAAVSAFGTEQ
jgi:hypothetical protein